MTPKLWSCKALMLITVIGATACVVALLSIGLTAHEPVTSTALGPEWQCSRFAFVLTTCSRAEHLEFGVGSPAQGAGTGATGGIIQFIENWSFRCRSYFKWR